MDKIKIEKFRGIKKGEIGGFKNVNIFVGKNNTGKSTILEALYLISNLGGEDILGRRPLEYIIKRREKYAPGFSGVEYLFYKGKVDGFYLENERHKLVIKESIADPEEVRFIIEHYIPHFDSVNVKVLVTEIDGKPVYRDYIDVNLNYFRYVADDQKSEIETASIFIDSFEIRKYGNSESIYEGLLKFGGKKGKERVINTLKKTFGKIEDMEIINNSLTILYETHSVPIYVMGDGFRVALPIVCLSSIVNGGIILLEEPENHQHPGSMDLIIENIIEASKTNKIFISTHNIEFLRKIVNRVHEENRDLKIYRTYLEEGELAYISYSCEESLEQIEKIRADLR